MLKFSCALPAMALDFREHLIQIQRTNPLFIKLYSYLDDQDQVSNVCILTCSSSFQDVWLIYDLLFYPKYLSSRKGLKDAIFTSLVNAIFH